jgi:GH24 family phage-related lysozyme (muramidase)
MSAEEVAGNYVMIGSEKVLLDRALTQQEIETLLSKTIVNYENAVRKAVTAKITQAQFDSLLSFTYNCGEGAIAKAELTKIVNAGDYERVPWGFFQWLKPKELLSRRQKEVALFMQGDYGFKKATNVTPGNTKVTGTTTTS